MLERSSHDVERRHCCHRRKLVRAACINYDRASTACACNLRSYCSWLCRPLCSAYYQAFGFSNTAQPILAVQASASGYMTDLCCPCIHMLLCCGCCGCRGCSDALHTHCPFRRSTGSAWCAPPPAGGTGTRVRCAVLCCAVLCCAARYSERSLPSIPARCGAVVSCRRVLAAVWWAAWRSLDFCLSPQPPCIAGQPINPSAPLDVALQGSNKEVLRARVPALRNADLGVQFKAS